MDVNRLSAFKTILLLTACAPKMDAQLPSGSIIRFEIENSTLYQYDCPYSQLGTNPNRLDYPIPLSGFKAGVAIGDIVSVNGSPAKGSAYESSVALFVGSPNIVPGQPITDDGRSGIASWDLTFMNPDGTQIGAVHVDGMIGGGRTPGVPSALSGGSYSVTGGTGAFFGVRGYFSAAQARQPTRRRWANALPQPARIPL